MSQKCEDFVEFEGVVVFGDWLEGLFPNLAEQEGVAAGFEVDWE